MVTPVLFILTLYFNHIILLQNHVMTCLHKRPTASNSSTRVLVTLITTQLHSPWSHTATLYGVSSWVEIHTNAHQYNTYTHRMLKIKIWNLDVNTLGSRGLKNINQQEVITECLHSNFCRGVLAV